MQRSSDVKRSAGGTIKEVCSFCKYYRPVGWSREERGGGGEVGKLPGKITIGGGCQWRGGQGGPGGGGAIAPPPPPQPCGA